jgi:hypothetical protein
MPTCRHARRLTCTDGLRVRVDPGWVFCPPTQPAGHTLGITMQTEEKGQRVAYPLSPSRDLHPAARPLHPVKRPLKVKELGIVVISGVPRYLRTQQAIKLLRACTKRNSKCMQARKSSRIQWGPWIIGEGKKLCCDQWRSCFDSK